MIRDVVTRVRRWVVERHRPESDTLLVAGEAVVEVQDAETGEVLDRQVAQNRPKDSYMQSLVTAMNPNASATEIEATHYAVGTNGSDSVSGFLGGEVFRATVGATDNDGAEIELTGQISKDNANADKELKQMGLVDDAANEPINRFTIQGVDKTDEKILKIRMKTAHLAEEAI